ncbi:hypothetical protein D1AOALGA4SA_12881 [Olavius algarvensis Delta 1 endosymbiont]|nr:hypothetical protein D1AOALGA4SA_12881 [Olavius algarvensis Delta 1 endosymbiont]
MIYQKQIFVSILVVVACMLAANFAVAEETKPSGTITIESHSVALGFGVNWGHGTLKFKGKEYKFKLNGLSVVDLGVSNVSATGEVYHLRHLSDFAGTYNAASAGIAVAAGAGASYLENQHDVVIKITSKKQGVQFTLAAEGLRLKLIE